MMMVDNNILIYDLVCILQYLIVQMKILFSLLENELCVCAIAELLGMEQSAISHQLKKLRQANLVSFRREGKTKYYFLADEHVKTVISVGFNHLTERLADNE